LPIHVEQVARTLVVVGDVPHSFDGAWPYREWEHNDPQPRQALPHTGRQRRVDLGSPMRTHPCLHRGVHAGAGWECASHDHDQAGQRQQIQGEGDPPARRELAGDDRRDDREGDDGDRHERHLVGDRAEHPAELGEPRRTPKWRDGDEDHRCEHDRAHWNGADHGRAGVIRA
jgi:hypothetical protein